MENATSQLRPTERPANPGERPDAELLAAWHAGRDDDAFAVLVRRHGPLVLGVCRRRLDSAFDVEDAFQATFLILARQAHRLSQTPTLAPWLHRVAWRTTANLRRRNWWRRWRTGPLPEAHPVAPGRGAEEAALHMDLDAALLTLPPRDRAAVLLCHVQGHSRKDAAAALGCPEGTLSAILHRALGKLRRRLRAHDPAAALAVAAIPLPPELVPRTVLAADALRAGAAALPAGLAPQVWTLAKGTSTMELLRRGGIAALAVIAAGVALANLPAAAEDNPKPNAAASKPMLPAKAIDAKDFAASPPVNVKVLDALGKPVELDFNKKPLHEALEELAVKAGIPILLDEKGLEDSNTPRDHDVSMGLKGETLESSLEMLLEPLDLDFHPRGGVLVVTSADKAKGRQYPRFYPVADLLVSGANQQVDASNLMETLRIVTGEADEWVEDGGTACMTYFPAAMSLAVNHHYRGHRAIEAALTELRAARAATNAALRKLNLPEIDAYTVKPAPQWVGGAAGGGGIGGGGRGGFGGGAGPAAAAPAAPKPAQGGGGGGGG